MGEPRHTPGPWEVARGDCFIIEAESYPKAYPAHLRFQSDDTGGALAYVGNREDDFGEANARLIAAAPDLVEALTTLLAYFGGPQDVRLTELGHDAYVALEMKVRIGDLIIARAALAKATGGDR
jgi:hypothetical protein